MYYIRILIILGIIAIGILVIIVNFKKDNPKDKIEKKLNIIIPSNAKIINYENKNDYLAVKILVEKSDVEYLRKQLNNFFGKESKERRDMIPMIENIYEWWDLKDKDIEVSYTTFLTGEKKFFSGTIKTVEVWAFLCKDSNDNNYLYISY